jgi:hypothetical protein
MGRTSHSIFGENTEKMRQAGPAGGLAAHCPFPVFTGGRCTLGVGSAGGGLLSVELDQGHQALR